MTYTDDRPTLSEQEIQNAVAVYKSFTNPVNKIRLRNLFEKEVHRESLFRFHELTWNHNEAPKPGDWAALTESDKEAFSELRQNILDGVE